MKITISGMIACAALAFASQAMGAAVKAPDQVGPFLKYCVKNHSDCLTSMMSDEIAANLSGNAQCDIPRGIETGAGNAQVLDWLKAHPETHTLPLHDGMQAAMKSIWNCAAAVKTGMTSMGAPDTVGPFLAFCEDKHHYNKCANEIVGDNLAVYAGTKGLNDSASGHCPSPDNIDTPELTQKILGWLRQHPELADQDIETSVWTAGDALWPCH